MKINTRILTILLLAEFTSVTSSCIEKRSSSKKYLHADTRYLTELTSNEAKFKQWLKDTLVVLQLQTSGEFKRVIILSADSLSMDIKDSYSLKMDSSYEGRNKEIIYALDLIARNQIIPPGKFNFDFEIACYYSVPMVEQLTYEFDSEILKFKIENDSQIINCNFIKGNLIDKSIAAKK